MEIENILRERQHTHGDFSENAEISQVIKAVLRRGSNYLRMTSWQKEALDMIAHKMSRIVAGNPDEPDHWKDICGYAQLVVNRVTGSVMVKEEDERVMVKEEDERVVMTRSNKVIL